MYPLFEAMTTTHSPLFILSTVFEIKLVEDLTEVSDVTIAFFSVLFLMNPLLLL